MSGEKPREKSAPPPSPLIGLCADCRHLLVQRGPRSVFARCGLAASDPGFPRYPRLPVLICNGFEPAAGERAAPPEE